MVPVFKCVSLEVVRQRKTYWTCQTIRLLENKLLFLWRLHWSRPHCATHFETPRLQSRVSTLWRAVTDWGRAVGLFAFCSDGFELAGRETRDFLRLGEGRDTQKFAQSCKQRASGSVVLESLGLAGVQRLLHTEAEYRARPTDISMGATQRATVVTIQVFYQPALCNMQWHQLHINQRHLLSRARHHMSWVPPSKSAFFSRVLDLLQIYAHAQADTSLWMSCE